MHQKLQYATDNVLKILKQVLTEHKPELKVEEVGTVKFVGQGIARVQGLPGVKSEEVVRFPGNLLGMVFNLDLEEVGVILLDKSEHLKAGCQVRRTGRVLDVPVGKALLGRVVDPMGRPLDSRGSVRLSQRRPAQREAPAIMERAPVTVPLQTGLKVVDALIPIGRGQRELILGDRQTGKTAIAIDTIINQKNQDVICIYCAIGQRSSSVARLIADLHKYQAMEYSLVVVAAGDEPPALQFIAPYAATTMAEYFMEQGRRCIWCRSTCWHKKQNIHSDRKD